MWWEKCPLLRMICRGNSLWVLEQSQVSILLIVCINSRAFVACLPCFSTASPMERQNAWQQGWVTCDAWSTSTMKYIGVVLHPAANTRYRRVANGRGGAYISQESLTTGNISSSTNQRWCPKESEEPYTSKRSHLLFDKGLGRTTPSGQRLKISFHRVCQREVWL